MAWAARTVLAEAAVDVGFVVYTRWRGVVELAGFGLLIYAGWLVAEPLGYAAAGLTCINFALGKGKQ